MFLEALGLPVHNEKERCRAYSWNNNRPAHVDKPVRKFKVSWFCLGIILLKKKSLISKKNFRGLKYLDNIFSKTKFVTIF